MKYNVYINADIGYPISANLIRERLRPFANKPCSVYIHSYGGSVREALDIYQQFVDHGDITAYVFGFTASAATLIAMGAKKIVMSDKAMMMIHQSSNLQYVYSYMNRDQITSFIEKLKQSQEMLEQVDSIAASIYAERAGGELNTFSELMKQGKWLTARKCKQLGLADELLEGGKGEKMSEELDAVMQSYNLPSVETDVVDVAEEESPFKAAFRKFAQTCGFALSEKPDAPEATPAAATTDKPAVAGNGAQEVKTQTTTNVMAKKTYETLMVALGVTALTVADNGSLTLNGAQAEALNAALGIARDEKKRLADENAQLKAQVEALQKADGSKTNHQGGNNADGDANLSIEERAAAMLNRVDKMIQ